MLARLLGRVRWAWMPVLVTYFCYGASAVTGVAELFFQKDVLKLAPAEAAGVAFWLGLPWSMKMIAGVASDVYPIFGSQRVAYLLFGAACTLGGYALLATTVATKATYLAAALLVTIGYMVQDVVADALSVEVARNDEEIGQIQALGRVAVLAGGISVGYLSGWLAGTVGSRVTFAVASALPLIVAASVLVARPAARPRPSPTDAAGPLSGGRAQIVLATGLAYAIFGAALEVLHIPYDQEIVLVVSLVLLGLLLRRVGISRGVAVAAIVIFLFRATPDVGQGYSYWAIDRLAFDERFLGVLAQVSSVLSLGGLLLFRKSIVRRPVSFTLFWVLIAGSVLYLPNIGLFYGLHEWLGISARTLAFIDTTISAPLAQLTMVPMLILIAKSAPPGAEATMFAVMASLMNLALSASQLFTQYLNELFQVTQQDYSNLGRLMIAVLVIGLLPLLALPLLWGAEQRGMGEPGRRPRSEPHPSQPEPAAQS
jgi:MFS family permease